MALNWINPAEGKLNEFEKRELDLYRNRTGIQIVPKGGAIITTLTFVSSELRTEKEIRGTTMQYSANNQTGASRAVTITITNVTKGITLFTDAPTVPGNGSITDNFYFSVEDIALGDTVSIALGNLGIGTAADATTLGSFLAELNTIFISEDETNVI